MKRVSQVVLFLALGASVPISNLLPSVCFAQRCEKWAAKAVSVQGTVLSQRAGEKPWQRVNLNDVFCPGDTLAVHEKSRADVLLSNESVLRLNENTSITFEQPKEEGTSLVNLFKGAAHFFSRRPRSLDVQTPYAVAGVRGTEFFIRVEEDRTFVSVFEGSVLASNKAGSLALTSGRSAEAEAGKAPVLRVVVRPRDAVQWALYYPPVLYAPPGEAPIKEDLNDPRFLAHRASVLLAVGRVDEAKADIERALRLKPDYSDAYALQSIIAVVQNDKDKALSLAQKAVELDPNSATARIALSYAHQARFDLEGSRATLEEAVRIKPDNALAWARLAELWASFGDLDKALSAAKKAAELNPNLSRTQTVLGFAYLTQVKTKEAKAAFDKAITLDQADYLPRLGLGLAEIRDGDLKDGGQEIEIAASLDPNNSLVRSYLGKVYYEEKRENLDQREYAVAKELDPNDPTPYFYDAIAKQTTNRPVEALQDIQKAIELNDNRAVYRSKLLLDSDLAARSASLGRIYSDLGFQQLALVEGWKSANTDPGNYSAHRFLADSYSVLPRHEIARVSELLQSQLLQPTNITPIQPTLAESNLFLISSEGPGALSFNEFNPLFNYNRVALQATGLIAENSTHAGEGIVSGIYKKLSFSAGYTGFETDGFRINNDQKDTIANVFAQYELSPKTSIQGEYRYRDNKRGDTTLRFFEDDFLPGLRQEDELKTGRLGFRQAFSSNSTLIGNFSYQKADRTYYDLEPIDPALFLLPPPPVESLAIGKSDEEAYSGELQYLFRSKQLNIVGGAGYFHTDIDFMFSQAFTWPGLTPPLDLLSSSEKEPSDIKHVNLYLYSYINLLKNVTFTVGASGDFYDDEVEGNPDLSQKEDQVNPKFGVTWNPVPSTTLRGAAFRTLKRTLITDQTLEPTQVAGFNQFYDDPDATEAWVYGAAVDQKFTKNIYGGVELVGRDTKAPYFIQPAFPGPFVRKKADWDERIGRAYLYWTPHKWFALSAEYVYERFLRDEEFTFGIKEVNTHRVPLGINFFHPSGFSIGLKATYYNQDGVFERQDAAPGEFVSGEDNFWLVDAAISYRLPKRYGLVTLGVTNLFDKSFRFVDTDLENPLVHPGRAVFFKVTLALP
jgi:tetratricopeptide (TPR) repeat protein